MTGRENVSRTITYGGPEYVPVELGFDPKWIAEKDEKKVDTIRKRGMW